MKKFLLSATLLVAFSLTSFAAEKTGLSKDEVKEKVETELKTNSNVQKTQQVDDTCVTVTVEWNETGATDDGMYIEFHKVELQVCW